VSCFVAAPLDWRSGDNHHESLRGGRGAGLGQNGRNGAAPAGAGEPGLQETTMNAWLASWQRRCGASAALRFIDINLRGVAQVMLQNNPLTGVLFFAAIAWGAFAAGAPEVLFGGVLALLTATLTAIWLRVAPEAVSVVATLATANLIRTWHLSALTFPFVIVTWALLLAAFAFAGVGGGLPPYGGDVAPLDTAASNPLDLAAFFAGVYHSISQVFLKASAVSALLFVAGLAVSSLPAALFAIGGAMLAVISAHLLGAESELVSAGLLGFSPVLTAITVGTVFYAPGLRVALYAALATLFTVIVQAAMNVAFAPLGVPALTAPFVLTAWLFLLPRQHLGEGSA
jgi:urea transporter